MSDEDEAVTIQVDGRALRVRCGTTVAAALLGAGAHAFRTSVTGEPRGPVCGMGVCFECRVTVDGVPHRLACQTACSDRMEVRTDGA
jgi:predicted molibdopterin-dependent oxidoreductase YjgC